MSYHLETYSLCDQTNESTHHRLTTHVFARKVCFVKNILVSPLQETPTSVQILVAKKKKKKNPHWQPNKNSGRRWPMVTPTCGLVWPQLQRDLPYRVKLGLGGSQPVWLRVCS